MSSRQQSWGGGIVFRALRYVLAMTHTEAAKRKRDLVVWIVTVATCAAAVLLDLLVQPLQVRVVGLDISSGLTGTAYVAVTAMCLTTFFWFRTARKTTRRITVRELRQRAGLRGVR